MSAITNNGSAASNASGSANRFADLSSEQFVKIMMSEMTNQDPLKPNDASHLLDQMSSLRQIESSMSLTKKLDTLVNQNQFASASGMLGAAVSGVTELGARAEGLVVSVTRNSSGPVLILQDGQRIGFSNIDEVYIPAPATQPTTNPPATTTGTLVPTIPVTLPATDETPVAPLIPATVPTSPAGSNV